MRYEPEHKTRTRERIIRNAARKLRVEGLRGPGVASVMKASGLTVGGFYKHFQSKDELLAEAIAQGFSEFSEKLHSSLQSVPPANRWKEIARAKVSVRKRIAALMKDLAEQWVEAMPGATATERERNFFVIFSAMAGT